MHVCACSSSPCGESLDSGKQITALQLAALYGPKVTFSPPSTNMCANCEYSLSQVEGCCCPCCQCGSGPPSSFTTLLLALQCLRGKLTHFGHVIRFDSSKIMNGGDIFLIGDYIRRGRTKCSSKATLEWVLMVYSSTCSSQLKEMLEVLNIQNKTPRRHFYFFVTEWTIPEVKKVFSNGGYRINWPSRKGSFDCQHCRRQILRGALAAD